MITSRAGRALAVFAALESAFAGTHAFADQWIQNCDDACDKGKPGSRGRLACARHAATYTATQTVTQYAVTRVLGAKVPVSVLAAGAVVTAATHYAIDRRTRFTQLLHTLKKTAYLEHATVQRRPGVIDSSGPGTALMEFDQSAHRLIGVATNLAMAWAAARSRATGSLDPL